MVTRRQGREWALQLLVQFDLNPPLMAENDIPVFWELQTELEAEARAEGEGVKAVFTDADPRVHLFFLFASSVTSSRTPTKSSFSLWVLNT